MSSQYGFYFDMSLCVGCRACQIACKDKNDLDRDIRFRHVCTYETGKYPNPGIYHLSSTCNHCENPACVAACPAGALSKLENGIVDHDPSICIGCKVCISACPYGAPQYIEEKKIASKCTMCRDLVENGKNPVCVDACMMRCLEFGELEELKAAHGDTVTTLPTLPAPHLTRPCSLISPRPNALTGDYAEREV